MLCCEANPEQRGAGNPHATLCGGRNYRMTILWFRLPGARAEMPWSTHPFRL